MEHSQLPPDIAALVAPARQAAATLMTEIDGARAVTIATADGFDLAHAGHSTIEPARLAAIVSALAALGDAASQETAIGTPRCLLVDCAQGRLVVRCVQIGGATVIVALLTDQSALLGLVWSSLARLDPLLAAA